MPDVCACVDVVLSLFCCVSLSLPLSMLLLSGLSPSTTEASIRQLFSHFGQLLSCQLCINPGTGISAQAAYVTYATVEESHRVAARAAAGQVQLDGRVLAVRPVVEQTQPQYHPQQHQQQPYNMQQMRY